MYLGAHVSIAGGIDNAPFNAAEAGCECFQMFTRSPRGGSAPKLTTILVKSFKDKCQEYNLKNYYIHAPYYINLASSDNKIRYGSIEIIRQELERGSKIGAKAIMTHIGSSKDLGKNQALKKVIVGVKKILTGYKGSTRFLLENSAGTGGTIIGGTFDEIGKIINSLKKFDIGVCLDTCHAFVSGYDLRSKQEVKKILKEFDQQIGLSKLVLIHANDAKTDFNSHKDRHEHIGYGKIGKVGFSELLKHPKLKKVDFILETPKDEIGIDDLKTLKKLRGK